MQLTQTMELNVMGEPLQVCNMEPLTGFTRNGCCCNHPADQGKHLVCVKVTAEFLDYSKQVGNDLSTPHPEDGFPGLTAGDYWCLCAERWQQSLEAGCAARIRLAATHINSLAICDIKDLQRHALDLA